MRLCDLRLREVINLHGCRRLGCVSEVDLDDCSGCIIALIVAGPGRICGFLGRDSEYIIPWDCVKEIGPDIILVDIDEEEALTKCLF